MAESQLNDAELRYVRASIACSAVTPDSWHDAARTQYGHKKADAIEATTKAARAALPAPTPEPEIVVEANSRCTCVIRRGTEFFGRGVWSKDAVSHHNGDAEIIAEALRAREKAAKRPRIEVAKRGE